MEQPKVTKRIIWLTGQNGNDKTTIANALQQKIGGVILDGDEMRSSISTDLGKFRHAGRSEIQSSTETGGGLACISFFGFVN